MFTENFDYQFFYPDFVNGLLTSDLLGKTICCTVLESDPASSAAGSRAPDWAFAVSNTKSYDAMSKAILARKAYPMAPDENMPNGSTRYEQRRARVYYGQDVDLSRCATAIRAKRCLLRTHPPGSCAQDLQDLVDLVDRIRFPHRTQHLHLAFCARLERANRLFMPDRQLLRL